MRSCRLFAFLLIFISVKCVATSDLELRFQRLTIEHGLSQTSVEAIAHDDSGFLWFATHDGLNRYDGYSFKYFRHDPQDKRSLSNNFVNTLLKDSQGRLWAGTKGGLNRFDHQSQQFIRYVHDAANVNSLSNNYVTAIVEAEHDIFWVATLGGGLNRLDAEKGTFTRFSYSPNTANSIATNYLRALQIDQQGIIWIGTNGSGLIKFNPKTRAFSDFRHMPEKANSLSNDSVYALLLDFNGWLWIGTYGGGLNKLNLTNDRIERIHFTAAQRSKDVTGVGRLDKIRAMATMDNKVLWLATSGQGLARFDIAKHALIYYQHHASNPNSLSHNGVHSVYFDERGLLWAGTFGVGVNKVGRKQRNFGHIKHYVGDEHSLASDMIMAIFNDADDNLWVGTWEDGVDLLLKGWRVFNHFTHDPNHSNSIAGNSVWAINQSSDGTLWFGTRRNGLSYYRSEENEGKGKFGHFRHEENNANSLSHNWVMEIDQDDDGFLWIGTRGGGLNRLDLLDNSFTHFRFDEEDEHSLSSDLVLDVKSHKEYVWVATLGGGLSRVHRHSGLVTRFKHDSNDDTTISDDYVTSILIDHKQQLWFGTFGGGVNRYDPVTEEFIHFREVDGLVNNTVYAIGEDFAHNLWMSTNKGLSQFNPDTGEFKNYDSVDGLQSNEFNGDAFTRNSKGELFFGGINGLNRFQPERIRIDLVPPKIVFTDMLLLNRSVPIENELRLSADGERLYTLPAAIDVLDEIAIGHSESLVAFEFAALDFSDPKKNQYAYKLVGQDENWIYTDANNRRATYTNLAAGDYVLKVKASNTDGVWNEQGIELKLTVLPPWWRTWWAYLIYMLLFSSPMFIYIRIQRRRVAYEYEQNLLLERKVTERTQALERKNNKILATQQKLVQAEKMASLGTLTAGVAHEINNPNNFVYVSAQNLANDIAAVEGFFIDLASEEADEEMIYCFKQKFEQLSAHVRLIEDGSQRIKIIVRDLHSFTQIDDCEQKCVRITDLLRSTVTLVQAKYVKVIDFHLEFVDEPHLSCYPAQLNQVFMNLLVNACHAIGEMLDKRDTKGNIWVRCYQMGQQIVIEIEDDGCGMTHEVRDKLFEPFFTTKEVGKGTGLGLSISYGIVQNHGGVLSVESVVGEGTVFTLQL